ncbi:hypothetical protein [Subtercola vilae]|uniref:Uncharacterized protein n=1 Tax=Subtercola vilae TaxID=2056433 RepID=A0A4T2BLA6_9MICO|nr:hypothetical protein [Subtercola vilae]TIH30791.1 hypothetical protein D4765_16935 [Subtercola vilae]
MTGDAYPTTWLFNLDERSVRMSLLPTAPGEPAIMATPASIRTMLFGFARSPATPNDVGSLLEVLV